MATDYTKVPFQTKSEAIDYCKSVGLDVKKVGETQYEIGNGKGSFRLNQNCKTLPFYQRSEILFLIFCLGAPIVAGIVLVWINWPSIQLMLK